MNISSSLNTIYVGNIQSIKIDQLREYFERFGSVEEIFHHCTRATDDWLIDYRFIRFSEDTDIHIFIKNPVDHFICRNRLDIHPYDAAFSTDTRFISDRKICIAHTNSKLPRNVIMKAFKKYGRILNCTCVSSGNGVEYVYIEYESINSIKSVFARNQDHFAGRTSLAVQQPLRPSNNSTKVEWKSIRENDSKDLLNHSRMRTYVDTARFSSNCANYNNYDSERQVHMSCVSSNSVRESQEQLLTLSNSQPSTEFNRFSIQMCSEQQLKDYENEYGLIIRRDFDEITYQIDKLLENQGQSYRKLEEFILNKYHTQPNSSSCEDGEIESTSSSSDSEYSKCRRKKRVKSRH